MFDSTIITSSTISPLIILIYKTYYCFNIVFYSISYNKILNYILKDTE